MFALRRACARIHVPLSRNLSKIPPLPSADQWQKFFVVTGLSDRVTLKDEALADKLAEAFLTDDSGSSSEGKIVIEAFPGPGCLTRSLLKLPTSKIRKLIVLEEAEPFQEYLKPLESADPRVTFLPLSGFDWSTYSEMEARGILNDVITKNWEEEPPNLHFVAQLPNSVLGEQLTNQFFRHIPERTWLFKYGRVAMGLLFSDNTYRRIKATQKHQEYCKLTVIANASLTFKEAVPWNDLQPYKDHFHPPPVPGEIVVERRGAKRPRGSPYAAVKIMPKERPAIEQSRLDKWDYVLRRLFVLKTTPLRSAITSLGPGASNLLPILSDSTLPPEERVDVKKKIRDLSMNDWRVITKRFDEWPFRPEDLDISDAIYRDIERSKA